MHRPEAIRYFGTLYTSIDYIIRLTKHLISVLLNYTEEGTQHPLATADVNTHYTPCLTLCPLYL